MKVDLLKIENLDVNYGDAPILRGVSMTVQPKRILGIVGESGSGKSTLILATMGILGKGGTIINGKIYFNDVELLKLSREEMRRVRGNEIALIMQNPIASFSPVRIIKHQLHEAVRSHGSLSCAEADERMLELLSRMKLPGGKRIMNSYAFEMSGGMCQRTSVAMAMVLRPQLLLADEPTSELDVTVQAQVVEELMNLRNEYGASIVIVSHNMGVISHMADQIAVMHAGMILEYGEKRELIEHPVHMYTKNIIKAIPRLDAPPPRGVISFKFDRTLKGCPIQIGCPNCFSKCIEETPAIREVKSGHFVRCWLA
jgi:oligopeptide/dipeptide ABC transporter ATP-binding protein